MVKKLRAAVWTRQWLAIVGAATIIIMASYVFAYQSARSAANELPRIISSAVERQLKSGAAPADTVPPSDTNLRDLSNGFVIITDEKAQILTTSAKLDGKPAMPPTSSFVLAKKHGQNELTWQPTKGLRLATLIKPYENGDVKLFIVSGQSLAETEKRLSSFIAVAILAWLATIIWVTLALRWGVKESASHRQKNRIDIDIR